MTGDIDWIEVNREAWESLCHRVISSEHKQYRLQEANVALHKGIRRLNNKIERLQGQLRMACEDIAHLQYQSDVEQGIEPPAFGVPQRFIDEVLKEYQLLLKEESLRDQS